MPAPARFSDCSGGNEADQHHRSHRGAFNTFEMQPQEVRTLGRAAKLIHRQIQV